MEDLNAYKCSVSPNYELNNILMALSNVMCLSNFVYITEQLSVSPIYVYTVRAEIGIRSDKQNCMGR